MDHEAFIHVVATAAQLDREDAERATHAVLQTLAERIDRGEARDLAARLHERALFRVRTPTEGYDRDAICRYRFRAKEIALIQLM